MRCDVVAGSSLAVVVVIAGAMQMLHTQRLEDRLDSVSEDFRRTQEQLAGAQAQLAGTQQQLADHVTASRNEMTVARNELVDMRRVLMDAESRAKGESGPGRRSLQAAEESGICLDPTDIAVSAMDAVWAVSRAFDRFLGGSRDSLTFPEIVAQLDELRAAISAANASMFQAVSGTGGGATVHTPAAEAAEAAALASGCEASTTEPATVCAEPEDGLVSTGCSVSSGEGACTAVPHTCDSSPETCPMTVLFNSKADLSMLDSKAEISMLDEKADLSVVNLLSDSIDEVQTQIGLPPAEVMPCRCRSCADLPVGGTLCASFGPATPCDCTDTSGSTDPARQIYPIASIDPVCCQPSWPGNTTLSQVRTNSPQEYDQDDILLRVGGSVTFVMSKIVMLARFVVLSVLLT